MLEKIMDQRIVAPAGRFVTTYQRTTDLCCAGHGWLYLLPFGARYSRLHDSHRSIEVTKRRAHQVVWWPGINSVMVNCVKGCDACQELLLSQPKEPLLFDVSADLLHMPVRIISFPLTVCLDDLVLRNTIGRHRHALLTKLLCRLFRDVSVPVRLRTDGGPQFASLTFRSFVQR